MYGVGFSTLIFTVVAESYLYSAFFIFCFMYYTCYLYINNEKLDIKKDFIIASLILFTFGVNIINLLVSSLWFILLLFLFRDTLQNKIKNLLIIFTILFSLIISFIVIEKFFYNINPKAYSEVIKSDYTFGLNTGGLPSKIIPSVSGIYLHGLYATEIMDLDDYIEGQNVKQVTFKDIDNITAFLPFIALIIFTFMVFAARYKNIDKKPLIFLLTVMCIINSRYKHSYNLRCIFLCYNIMFLSFFIIV